MELGHFSSLLLFISFDICGGSSLMPHSAFLSPILACQIHSDFLFAHCNTLPALSVCLLLLLRSVFLFSLHYLCFSVRMWRLRLLCLSDRCQGHSISRSSTLSLPHKHTRTHKTRHKMPTAAWCVVNRSVTADSLGGWSVGEICSQSCHWHIHVAK